jgi:membrane protease YdiL (CAAX protease family)
MSDKEILFHVYATQLLLFIVSIILGMILFNDIQSFIGLWEPDWFEIVIIGGGCAFAVIFLEYLLMKLLPDEMYDDGGVNQKIFQNRNVFHIFLLSVIIAFTEEVLFRGIIQTHIGLIWASLIFAFLHFRYLYKWVLFLMVNVLSFFLGFLFFITDNLFVPFFVHFLIDFVFALKIRNDDQRRGE